jgi:uroporphyrin-III C-methyltransferase/precorrin-2 dehydrogenase/sirohydrochlorin ferrochelatase|tara:strand:+ start:5978 stop:7405 length:1428 start_codon:yes stop_codon:yes gene_type:complete
VGEKMSYLPLFIETTGKKCLIVGGGKVASRKLIPILKAKMKVTLISPEVIEEIELNFQKNKNLKIIKRKFEPEDIEGQFLIIAATNEKTTNQKIAKLSKDNNILVNMAEDSLSGNTLIPSVVDRDPIKIAVSSGAASPILTRLVKTKLETVIPYSFSKLADIMMEYRDVVKKNFLKISDRRKFWEVFLDGPVSEMVLSGHIDKAKKALDESLKENKFLEKTGEVYLVGAGPGDPELLSFKALRLMQKADIVIYDRLVSRPIMNLIRQDAEKIYVGKQRADHAMPQENINQLLARLALEGKKVLRLKGGDPFIFGRGGEEIESLIKDDIPFQIVPGITAASGCASYAGIPLTHRDYSQACIFVTGHLRDGTVNLNWEMLAHEKQTLIFYMGMHGSKIICEELIKHGLSNETPAALIVKGTTEDQEVIIGNLKNMPEIIMDRKIVPPTLLIIGDVVKLHNKLKWFNPFHLENKNLHI